MDNLIKRYQLYGSVCFYSGSFSNFAHAEFVFDGQKFYTSEQCFMWKKAKLFGDEQTAAKILRAKTPKEQKQLGREVKGFNERIWTKHKVQCMYEACYAKFSQNPHLKEKLLQTGEAILIEASPNDKIWGIGARESEHVKDPRNWKGENLLGLILMKVRQDLR